MFSVLNKLTFYFTLLVSVNVFSQSNYIQEKLISESNLKSIENLGQWSDDIRFNIQLDFGNLYLQNNAFVYHLISNDDLEKIDNHHEHDKKNNQEEIIHFHALKLNFLNSNPDCVTKGIYQSETDYNYFIGKNPDKWVSGAKAYNGVEYQNIYKDIDLNLYEKNGHLKYDFVIKIGAKPELITLKYEGEDSIAFERGNLKITTSVNYLIEKKPVAYQIINGNYSEVQCNFVLLENKKIQFAFPNGYNLSYELVIDPELIFSTYSGSSGDNWGYTATYDNDGNAYSGGIAYNLDGLNVYNGYPADTFIGAYQSDFGGGASDVAISKYSEDGSTLLYATYLGGANDDRPMSMIVNSKDELVILGNTNSNDYPTSVGAYDNILNDGGNNFGHDIFITILSTNGGGLIGSTYVGGSAEDGFNFTPYFYGDEYRSEVIVDDLDNVYIASNTTSYDFPATSSSFDNSRNGKQDGCVFKMNDDVSGLVWAGFLGGNENDQACGIKLDDFNNVFVCGGTEGEGFPITTDAINPIFEGGKNIKGLYPGAFSSDGFVTKISSDGQSILTSTFLQSSTTSFEIAYLLEKDIDNNIFVFGITEGAYPISSGVYNNGQSSQFIHKLTSDLDSTLFTSTFGSGTNDAMLTPTAFMVDICNRIYVSGWGGDVSFQYDVNLPNSVFGYPITNDAIQPNTDGDDFYLAVFDKDMVSLNYATYFGGDGTGDHVDGGTSRFSPDGIVYQAVCADCGTNVGNDYFPTTPGVYSTTNNASNCNAAVFKIEFAFSTVKARIEENLIKDTVLCEPTELLLSNDSRNANQYIWYFDDGDSLFTYSDSSVTHFFDSLGVHFVMLISSNDGECFIKPIDTAFYYIKLLEPPIADAGEDTTIFSCDELELIGCCGPIYSWLPDYKIDDVNVLNPIVTPDESTNYILTVEDSNGCFALDTILIDVITLDFEIPNIFTPNNDEFNDEFIVEGYCGTIDLTLYNRWGKKVLYQEDYQNNFEGSELSDGLYYYLIENGGDSYKGWVQILR